MIRIESKIVPVIILEKGDKQEDVKDTFAYIIGRNGAFIKKENCLYSGVVKTDKADFLEDVKPVIKLNFTKLQKKMFQSIISFFKDVYKRDSSEATVLLYFSLEQKKWVWGVPKQENSGGSSSYKTDTMKFVDGETVTDRISPDFKLAGSIHSHASMGAFHSGTDDKDEVNFDGLHITIGNIPTEVSYAVRWMLSGQEMKGSIAEAVEDSALQEPFPKEVMEMCRAKTYGAQFMEDGYALGEHYGEGGFRGGFSCSSPGFNRGHFKDELVDVENRLTARDMSAAVEAEAHGFQFLGDISSWFMVRPEVQV